MGQFGIVLIPGDSRIPRQNAPMAQFEASGPLMLRVKGHNSRFIGRRDIVCLEGHEKMNVKLLLYFFAHVCFQWVSTQLHSIL